MIAQGPSIPEILADFSVMVVSEGYIPGLKVEAAGNLYPSTKEVRVEIGLDLFIPVTKLGGLLSGRGGDIGPYLAYNIHLSGYRMDLRAEVRW